MKTKDTAKAEYTCGTCRRSYLMTAKQWRRHVASKGHQNNLFRKSY